MQTPRTLDFSWPNGYPRFMKAPAILALSCSLLLSSAAKLHADTYFFLLNRYGYLQLDTEKKTVKVWQEDKSGEEEILFTGKLKLTANNIYMTDSGTVFSLTELGQKMVNDGNREINSGTWKLAVTKGRDSDGKEHEKVLSIMQGMLSFGDKKSPLFYGDKTD